MLKEKRDVNLCSLMALIYAHKMAKSVGMWMPLYLAALKQISSQTATSQTFIREGTEYICQRTTHLVF